MEYELGIVLSGGGSRGLSHIGVLKALGEAGIEPDCLAATSAGAIVAALYAAGYSPAEMLGFFETKSPFRVSKLALRKPGFIDTEKVVADFLEYFPDDSFEALGKKLFLTATDLVEGRLEIFASGRLIPAVLASSSVPMIFTPTEIEGRWFSDGGIVDNFPVEPLLGLCDTILGVYASPLRRSDRSHLKSSLAVSVRSFELAMYYSSRRKFHQCDLVICPEELTRFGTFDTRHYAEILDIGYRATRDRLDEIRSLLSDV
jgi:NTE family protein